MKKIVFSILLASGAFLVNAQPPKGPANKGNTYGEAIKADGAVDIATIPTALASKDTVNTKVIAKVLDVCPKKGCWMQVQVNDTTTAFVRMKDYGFFVPVEMIGKTIVLDGQANMKTTSVAELKHYAEDAKKSKEEIAAITKPEKEIRFLANGILVVN